MKKILSLLLMAALMMTVFAGCQKKEVIQDEPLPPSKENVYKAKKIKIPANFNVASVKLSDNDIVLFDGFSALTLDYDGNTVSNVKFSDTDSYFYMAKDSDGNYLTAASEYDQDNNEVIKKFHIVKFDTDGNEIDRIEVDAEFFGKDEQYGYLAGFAIDKEGNFYLQSAQTVYVFDKSGSYIFESASNPDNIGEVFFKSIFTLSDGRVASNYSGFNGNTNEFYIVIKIIDPAAKKAQDYKITTSDSSYSCIVCPSDDYDMLLCTNLGIYGYDLETGKKTGVFNSLDYGLDVSVLAECRLLPNGDIATVSTGSSWTIDDITCYVKLDPSEVSQLSEKKTITLAALDVDYWLKAYIAEFNKNSEDYKLEVKSYMDGVSDESEAVKKLNSDIMMGNIPDIIISGNGASSGSYINKGLFADLYTFMDNDPDFNKEDYLPNAFSALERDGKLYEIFPMFNIETVIAKTSDVGDKPGWTLDEFGQFLDTKPDAAYIIGDFTKKEFISRMVRNQFIDPKTGECSFDRGEFEKILKIAERFPQNELSSDTDQLKFEMGAKNGDPIMMRDIIMGFRSVRTAEVFYFEDKLTYKGYPSPYGNGSYFRTCANFSISEKANNPDGAWSFIKFMLDEYRDEYGIYMPIRLSDLEQMAEAATQPSFYLDQNGKKVESDYIVSFSSGTDTINDVFIGDNTAEDSAKVMDIIKSITTVRQNDNTIIGIVDEEIDAYISGQKSAENVIDVIENRVNLYISESN